MDYGITIQGNKGLVHPKMKMMTLMTHPHDVPSPKDLHSSLEHSLTLKLYSGQNSFDLFFKKYFP